MTTQKISMDMVYAIQAFACYRKANDLYVGFEHLRILDFILVFILIALDLVKEKYDSLTTSTTVLHREYFSLLSLRS